MLTTALEGHRTANRYGCPWGNSTCGGVRVGGVNVGGVSVGGVSDGGVGCCGCSGSPEARFFAGSSKSPSRLLISRRKILRVAPPRVMRPMLWSRSQASCRCPRRSRPATRRSLSLLASSANADSSARTAGSYCNYYIRQIIIRFN